MYNQAIMDFGATVCLPQVPLCVSCFLSNNCVAYKNGQTTKLPVKEKQLKKKKRWFTYLIFQIDNEVFIKKRPAGDVWEGLYEFYLIESKDAWEWETQLPILMKNILNVTEYEIKNVSRIYTQQLTHQTLEGRFITVNVKSIPQSFENFLRVDVNKLDFFTFPKFINLYMQEYIKRSVR